MNTLKFEVSNKTDDGRSLLTIGVPFVLHDYMRDVPIMKRFNTEPGAGVYYEPAGDDRKYIVDPKRLGTMSPARRALVLHSTAQLMLMLRLNADKKSTNCPDQDLFIDMAASPLGGVHRVTATIRNVDGSVLGDEAAQTAVLPHMASAYKDLFDPVAPPEARADAKVYAGTTFKSDFYLGVGEPQQTIASFERDKYAPQLPLHGETSSLEHALVLVMGAVALSNQASLQHGEQ